MSLHWICTVCITYFRRRKVCVDPLPAAPGPRRLLVDKAMEDDCEKFLLAAAGPPGSPVFRSCSELCICSRTITLFDGEKNKRRENTLLREQSQSAKVFKQTGF